MTPRRILFLAEAVTLAQVVRLKTLANSLDPREFEVHFASAQFPDLVFEPTFRGTRWHIHSLAPREYLRSQRWGYWPYTEGRLRRYVREDLELLDKIGPDAVIGDFRLSLTVSAPLKGVPYATLINGYWSPASELRPLPLPDHPLIPIFGRPWVERSLPKVERRILELMVRPLNELRTQFGLTPFQDLTGALTAADWVLYPDTPSLTPVRSLPPHHVFLGPVLWSAPVPLPPAWFREEGLPWIYVTLGSSGRASLLPFVLDTLAELSVRVMAATAGAPLPTRVPGNARLAPFLPGDQAAQRSALVITNGGSTTGYQALAAGTPVVGIAWNMDQYLAMRAMERKGAGILLRSGELSRDSLRRAVLCLLKESSFRERAKAIAEDFKRYDACQRFRWVLEKLLDRNGGMDRGGCDASNVPSPRAHS